MEKVTESLRATLDTGFWRNWLAQRPPKPPVRGSSPLNPAMRPMAVGVFEVSDQT